MKTDNSLVKKWMDLFEEITILKNSSLICTIDEIEKSERELGFRFPSGYKEFCLVFGGGVFGKGKLPSEFRIYCPTCPQISSDLRNVGFDLIGLKLDLENSDLYHSKKSLPYRLLENGCIFAGTPNADNFFWDLTSFSENDKSYDIYWKRDEDVEGIELVGRDFFEFIEKFCLGNGLNKIYSFAEDEYEITDSDEKFFTAFENYEVDRSLYKINTQEVWERQLVNLENAIIYGSVKNLKLTCSYDAKNKQEAECIENEWKKVSSANVEIIEGSKRSFVPRLVKVSISIDENNKQNLEEIIQKVDKIGQKCGCRISSLGSRSSKV